MNPADPPPPLQPHRPSFSSTTCDRHPDEQFTGFCPSCLCERLSVLDHSSSLRKPNPTATTATTSSTAAAALKAIFKVSASTSSSAATAGGPSDKGSSLRSKPSFFPELRRTKSFSASKGEGFSGVFEPQRKSCDVRVRNTLWALFHQDDGRKGTKTTEVEVETRNLGCSSSSFVVGGPVFESKEEDEDEDEDEEEGEEEEENEEEDEVEDDEEDEIRVSEEQQQQHNVVVNGVEDRIEEIVEEAIEEEIVQEEEVEEEEEEEEVKTMKDHIDLDSQNKKAPGRDFKEIAGSFWSAASVFSKKLQKWRRKQKMKKHGNGGGSSTLPVEKPMGRQFRETQSEIADYGFGRRSCDTDPRFSLDAGRISFDDPRYSFEEPRASWDGYLIGKTFPRLTPMLSVVEDAPVHHIPRCDTQIPVEEPRISISINDEETIPGGSVQTRDYYSDSSSKRRKSLDRSNSIRKTAAAVVAEIDEMKSSVSIAKVSPELRDSNSNSLRDDCSETFELGLRDNASIMGNGDKKEPNKKSRRWSKAWNIWGLIHWKGGAKDEDDDRYSRTNGVERSFSESWQDLRTERNGDARGAFNRKIFRSNSSVSWRNSNGIGGSFGSARKSSAEMNGHGKKKRDEFVLERNRSARYSPSHVDNGLLRFYLTPMRSSWRSASTGKSRPSSAHSIARSVLRLY